MLALLLGTARGSAQSLRVVVLVDFVDQSTEGWMVGVGQIAVPSIVQALAKAPQLRVIAGDPVRDVLRQRGWLPADLVSPLRSAEVGRVLGAEWVVTGRWITAEVTGLPDEPPGTTMVPSFREGLARAAVEVRVLEVASRRVLRQEVVRAQAFGPPSRMLLLEAAEAALRQVATILARL
ncbi:MAG: hypothetical protein QN152_13285 [Armatimonadota bacterium]|nr:hypothetical protein [Armatimonadota bacterium]MDR7473425.1 hypothetical protein [Armatimonadota bacterium]MDR7540479.1 hypothetical protein [Armatimonadota bacterium]